MAVQAPTNVRVNYWPTDANGVHIVEASSAAIYFTPSNATAYKFYGYQSDDGVTWPSEPIRSFDVDGSEPNGNNEISCYFVLPTPWKYYRAAIAAVSGGSESAKVYSAVMYYKLPTSKVGSPSDVKVEKTFSNDEVDLTWKAGGDGIDNNVTGYDVQYRDSADGNTWGSWATASGSPTTDTKLSVSPPDTIGYYRQFRVRTRGSAGSSYYSAYVTSSNTLRKDHDALEAFTDPTLTARVSVVKALYITELQSRVNTLRTFYGLSSYSFTTCTAGVTKIAKWTDLVNEIRTAIDGVCTASGKTHADWIVFDVNCPRVDVIQQLRDVVMAL